MKDTVLFETERLKLTKDVDSKQDKLPCDRIYEARRDNFNNRYWVQVKCFQESSAEDKVIAGLLEAILDCRPHVWESRMMLGDPAEPNERVVVCKNCGAQKTDE